MLGVSAPHPRGTFTATAQSTFTVEGSAETILNAYDEAGNVTNRQWSDGRYQGDPNCE